MKKHILLLFIISFWCRQSYALPENPQAIKAPVISVKVYLNAALITHSQKVKIKPGINKFVFLGLASEINEQNIRIKNIGNSELLSLSLVKISDSTDIFSLNSEVLDMIRNNKDSLITLERGIMKMKYEIEALELEKNMLIKNDDIIANGRQITAAELKLTTDFYRERYKDVSIEIINKQKDIRQLKKNKIKMLKSVFNVTNEQEKNMNVSVIITELNNPGAEYSTELELAYLAIESGWIPVYNINATNNSSLKIEYRARVLNNTGIDWNNMNITLSTADPFQYYSAPDLEPFYVSQAYRYRNQNQNMLNSIKQQRKGSVEIEEIFVPEREITFNISKRYSFSAGLTPCLVDVTTYDLNPFFLYRSAPKKEEQVYAMVKIKGWEKLNLIDGEANIYNNGIFLGKSYIRPSDIEEELELPLGVVDNIFVKHKLVSEFSSKKVLANEVVATQTYEIKLKNNSSTKISLEIIDQVPVSEQSSVKTEILEMTDGAEKDPLTGKITWKQQLEPSSEKNITLKYSVTYPKGSGYGLNKSYNKSQVRSKF